MNGGARPDELVAEVRRICAGLPQIEEDEGATRVAFKVGRRIVASVVTVEDPGGQPVTVLTANGVESELEFLIAVGHPFFQLRSGPAGRIGVILDTATDWSEIEEIVTDSYLVTAPKRLAAKLGLEPDDRGD